MKEGFDGQPTSDGAGVKLRRVLGSRALPMLDPLLMLDEFHTDKAGDVGTSSRRAGTDPSVASIVLAFTPAS